jgi:hypothetical protein
MSLPVRALSGILGLGFFVASSGCVLFVPPIAEIPAQGYHTRDRISEEAVKFIQDGATTKEAVLLHLGEPDEVGKDEKRFLYWTATQSGAWIVALPGGGEGSVPFREYVSVLVIEFDDQNIVKRSQSKKRTVEPGYARTAVAEEMRLLDWGP